MGTGKGWLLAGYVAILGLLGLRFIRWPDYYEYVAYDTDIEMFYGAIVFMIAGVGMAVALRFSGLKGEKRMKRTGVIGTVWLAILLIGIFAAEMNLYISIAVAFMVLPAGVNLMTWYYYGRNKTWKILTAVQGVALAAMGGMSAYYFSTEFNENVFTLVAILCGVLAFVIVDAIVMIGATKSGKGAK